MDKKYLKDSIFSKLVFVPQPVAQMLLLPLKLAWRSGDNYKYSNLKHGVSE